MLPYTIYVIPFSPFKKARRCYITNPSFAGRI